MHGDDFTSSGPKRQLDMLKAKMEEKYELKENYRIGPGPEDAREARILNRIVRWTADGLEYEADPRQGEKMVESLGLGGAKSLGTPGVKQTHGAVKEDRALGEGKRTAFRAVAARGNDLAADRPEVQFSAK